MLPQSLTPVLGTSSGHGRLTLSGIGRGANPPKAIHMSGTVTEFALAGAFTLGLAAAAFAATGEFNNMCSWGLANHKDVQTDCSVNGTIKGKTYCFSNEEAKANFMKDPEGNLVKAAAYYKNA